MLTSSWQNAVTMHEMCVNAVSKSYFALKSVAIYGTDCQDKHEVRTSGRTKTTTAHLSNHLNYFFQIDLINGCDVLIATPHSLLRMLKKQRGATDLKRVCHIVRKRTLELRQVFKMASKSRGCVFYRCLMMPMFCAIRFTSLLRRL